MKLGYGQHFSECAGRVVKQISYQSDDYQGTSGPVTWDYFRVEFEDRSMIRVNFNFSEERFNRVGGADFNWKGPRD